MTFKDISQALGSNRPSCHFSIGNDPSTDFEGIFLGFWADEHALVGVTKDTLEALEAWSMNDGNNPGDFSLPLQSDGLYHLADHTVTLKSVDLSPELAAKLLHAAALSVDSWWARPAVAGLRLR